MIKIGIIGAGAVSEQHQLPGFQKCKGTQVTALADINKKRAEKLARRFGVRSVYADWKKMIQKEDLDAVSIATPNYLHCQMSVYASNRGRHVLVEKPMATSMSEARRMVQAARKNRRILMVEQTHRFHPQNQLAKRLIAQGKIGKVNTVKAKFGGPGPEYWSPEGKWFFSKDAFGGAMADIGIHSMDLIRYLTGKEVKEVFAYLGTLEKKIEVDDNGICLFKFADGTLGSMEASWTTKPQLMETILYGEKGTMAVKAWVDDLLTINLAGGKVLRPRIPRRSETGSPYEYFVHCIKTGEEPFISGEEGGKSLEVILAAYKSAATGRKVRLT